MLESEQEKFIVKLNLKLGKAMAYLLNEDYEKALQALGDQSDIISEYINKNNLFKSESLTTDRISKKLMKDDDELSNKFGKGSISNGKL